MLFQYQPCPISDESEGGLVIPTSDESGLVTSNPCRQVRKNKERPRTRCPSWAEIESFCQTAKARGSSSHTIGLMAKFIALTGRRRAEFIRMTKADLTNDGIRVVYAKGRVGDPIRPAVHRAGLQGHVGEDHGRLDSKRRRAVHIPRSAGLLRQRDGRAKTESRDPCKSSHNPKNP